MMSDVNPPHSSEASETAGVASQPAVVAPSLAAEKAPSTADATPETAQAASPVEASTPGETSGSADDQAAAADAAPTEMPVIPEETSALPAEETAPSEKKPAAESTGSHLSQLYAAAVAHGHPEVWGVTLADPETHVPSQIIFQKYLNANEGIFSKAKDQLIKTLDWRAQMKPLELLEKTFDKAKFDGVGYVTSYTDDTVEGPESKEVFTWNVYGIVKKMEETFGDKDGFIKWRVCLMELALHELSLSTATKPITEDYDPYKIYQVHDYKSVSFFRQNPAVREASAETIRVFAQNYPELLKEKFFVNVPAIMGWMYGIIKLFVAPRTLKKFHPMANGANLTYEFTSTKITTLGEKIPKEYGGKGEDLGVQGKQTQLA
ncbi:CRAL-TRIO domain-containing protein [Xylariales sp. PMI_506]|nr:CRAL-TRIO domain-containing protein [Xylariales sp. PMI_506]